MGEEPSPSRNHLRDFYSDEDVPHFSPQRPRVFYHEKSREAYVIERLRVVVGTPPWYHSFVPTCWRALTQDDVYIDVTIVGRTHVERDLVGGASAGWLLREHMDDVVAGEEDLKQSWESVKQAFIQAGNLRTMAAA